MFSARTAHDKSTSTAKQSSSKHSPSESSNSKSKTSPSQPSSTAAKDKNNKVTPTSATPVKKTKHGASDSLNSADHSGSEGPASKKKKLQYVDAVEKLENSTSIHVPKKLMLFVGNLPEDITKEQIMEHFKRTGKN